GAVVSHTDLCHVIQDLDRRQRHVGTLSGTDAAAAVTAAGPEGAVSTHNGSEGIGGGDGGAVVHDLGPYTLDGAAHHIFVVAGTAVAQLAVVVVAAYPNAAVGFQRHRILPAAADC